MTVFSDKITNINAAVTKWYTYATQNRAGKPMRVKSLPRHMNCIFLVMVGTVTLLEISADILFKEWALKNQIFLLIIGILLYTGSTIVWAFSLKQESLSKAISIFTVLSFIVIVLIGHYFFKENITGLQFVGICLGLASIVLLIV